MRFKRDLLFVQKSLTFINQIENLPMWEMVKQYNRINSCIVKVGISDCYLSHIWLYHIIQFEDYTLFAYIGDQIYPNILNLKCKKVFEFHQFNVFHSLLLSKFSWFGFYWLDQQWPSINVILYNILIAINITNISSCKLCLMNNIKCKFH